MHLDCAKFEEILPDLGRWGPEESVQLADVLAHAETCSRCAQLLVEAESLDFALRKLAESDAGRQAPPRVEAALLTEFRGMRAVSSRGKGQWKLAVLGAAAVFFLALGLSLRQPHAPIGSAVPVSIGVASSTPSGATQTQAKAHRAPVAAQPHGMQDEIASHGPDSTAQFVRVPYADDASTLEGAAIVRVILPRSALASFGLTVAEAGTAERIPADLVVSADGTPEAIRLVAQTN